VVKLLKSLPKDMHPMTQFSMGVMACQPESKFAKAYKEGLHKNKQWESTFEDALDVCAKASKIASIVYHNSYGNVR
jgi:citrate synthase